MYKSICLVSSSEVNFLIHSYLTMRHCYYILESLWFMLYPSLASSVHPYMEHVYMYASLAPASLTTTQLWLFVYLSLTSFCEHGPVWVIHHVPGYFFWPPTSKRVCAHPCYCFAQRFHASFCETECVYHYVWRCTKTYCVKYVRIESAVNFLWIISVVYIMLLQITYQHKALQIPQTLEQKALQSALKLESYIRPGKNFPYISYEA